MRAREEGGFRVSHAMTDHEPCGGLARSLGVIGRLAHGHLSPAMTDHVHVLHAMTDHVSHATTDHVHAEHVAHFTCLLCIVQIDAT